MKHEKKYEILSGLDERLLEDALRNREEMMRPTVNRRTERFRRVVLLCACLTLLCASLVVMGVVGLSMVTGDRPGETETQQETPPHLELSDSQLLSLGEESHSLITLGIQEPKDDTLASAEMMENIFDLPAQIISFHASPDETVTIYPGRGAVQEVMECPHTGRDRYCFAHVGRLADTQDEYCHIVEPFLQYYVYSDALAGTPLTVAGDAKVVWQFYVKDKDYDKPDQLNYVVRNKDGTVTGVGSIYVDTRPLFKAENKVGQLRYELMLRRCVSLGSRTYTREDGMTDEYAARLFDLYATRAEEATEGLFDELTVQERMILTRAALFNAILSDGQITGYKLSSVGCDLENPAYLLTMHGTEKIYFFCLDGWYPVAEVCPHPDYKWEWILLTDGRKVVIRDNKWYFEDTTDTQFETT